MSTSPPPPTPLADLPDGLIERLRADLLAADYTVDGVTATLGDVAAAAVHRDHLGPARRVLRDAQGPLATMLRLFALGEVVTRDELASAFPRAGVDGIVRLGLVITEQAGARAAWDLRPYGDEEHTWWVASDLAEVTTGAPLHADHVLGVGGASLTLAGWTPRRPAGRVLDLGTGCGVQALHAGRHAEVIVATDFSGRALRFAALNAALAGATWDLREGDLFTPVTGDQGPETFDLVVSNPPFVITPRSADLPVYEYRDGGRAGHALVETVVRGLPAHLAPGGLACVLVNWEVGTGQDWREVWRAWLETPECADLDAWVLARESQDVAEYAEIWTRDSGQRPGTPEFERWVDAWLDDFAVRDVERVWFGVLLLQRPATDRPRWVDLAEATGVVDAPMGPHIAAGLDARTRLAALDDDALLAAAWQVAPDVTEERHTRPGASDPSVILVRQGGGLRRAIQADTALAAFVSVCDGDLTAGVAVTAIAALLEEDAAAVRSRILPSLRQLVADGLLVETTV